MSKKEEQAIELLKELAKVRESLATAKAAKKSLEEQPVYIAASRTVATHSALIGTIESELRALGLEIFEENGEKDILHGVKHKSETVVSIVDEVQALEYCRDKFFDGLALDKKALEKHAKSAKYPLEFVTISEVDKISLPKKINITALNLVSGVKTK